MMFELNAITVIVMAALGGLAAYLANQNIAVFHDGLRPVYPQYLNGAIDRKTLFATTFALSFGLIVGFGIPTSIAGKIIIIHTVLLGTDIIGTAFPDNKKGGMISAAAGAVFGIILLFGMEYITRLIEIMPINFLGDLKSVGDLIIVSFCVFPALAIGYQAGVKKGFISLGAIMLVKQIFSVFGKIDINGVTIQINAEGMALIVGIGAMVIVAARTKREKGNAADVFSVFGENIKRIKKNMVILAVCSGVVALATTLMIIAEGPASQVATADGLIQEAVMIALGRCIGFIPLVMTTAIISGVYSPCGTKANHIPALLLINAGVMGLVGSFFIGALIMVVEVLLLGFLAKGMDKFPGMKELGDNTRTAMSKTLDIALLVGGMIAANTIAPTIGYIWVIGLYVLNQISKKPVSTMAVGPLGAISLGVIVNVLHVLQLFPIVVK